MIDHFAARNMGIRTMERASGFIAAEPVAVPLPKPGSDPKARDELADCGRTSRGWVGHPTRATYNVVVRGDSANSTVRVTVLWQSSQNPQFECTTRGVWESAFEAAVKERAEQPKVP